MRATRSIWLVALVAGCATVVSARPTMASSSPGPIYDIAATQACLRGLPNAVSGLPPASPPASPALFVYHYPRNRTFRRALGQLGVWYGRGPASAYQGATVVVFRDVQDARRWETGQTGVDIDGNVAIRWGDLPAPSTQRWARALEGCLRTAGFVGPPVRPAPRASLATFVGYWGGHTRGLRVTSTGRGHEFADDGCCRRDYDMTFQILAVTGTLTRASAVYRVTSIESRRRSGIRTGRRGTLHLRNGIVTSSLTRDYFCSDPAWIATLACGA